ncbi:MAG: ftsQ [Gammaproteobacteria bacterium]|jgi:cell division protein FtsQ|nr:ftsQ [Gammaproteobacteria bacterium]
MIPGSYSKDDELVQPRKRHKVAQASSPDTYLEIPYLRWLSRFLLLTLLGCIGYAGWGALLNPSYFPLAKIKVSGEFHHINPTAIQQLMAPYLQQGFFGVNTTALQDELQQLPWVNRVSIGRSWPKALSVTLVEHQPIAHWNGNALVNNQGQVFTPPNVNAEQNIPYFVGPLGQQILMLKTYQNLNPLLQALSLSIKQLYLTDRHAWQLQLSNGIIVNLGSQDILDRLKRFITIYQRLFAARATEVDYIDMRYSNGIAVKWNN